ncbi:hypothetical protein ILYODFUR_001043 [Ilyodon furcidens]|uniref:Uncharacterized protein n=1 Tax=Ilyodon furcidens TaxID=33524 RepID=A0ABV0UZ65_9TELE
MFNLLLFVHTHKLKIQAKWENKECRQLVSKYRNPYKQIHFHHQYCIQVNVDCEFSTTHIVLHVGEKVCFWPHLTTAPSSTCLLCALHGLLQTSNRILIDFFQQSLSSCHRSLKARFVELTTNSCLANRFSNLSCGSLQLLQSYHRSLGFSD